MAAINLECGFELKSNLEEKSNQIEQQLTDLLLGLIQAHRFSQRTFKILALLQCAFALLAVW